MRSFTSDLVFLIPYLISVTISTLVGMGCWRRSNPVSRTYAIIAFSQASWSAGLVLEMLSPTMQGKLFWDNFQWLGAAGWIFGFIAFTAKYTGLQVKSLRNLISALGFPFAVFIGLAYTDAWHSLIRIKPHLQQETHFTMLMYGFTTLNWIMAFYLYVLFLGCGYLLAARVFRAPSIYRNQAILVFLGNLIPILGTLFALAHLEHFPYRDISPFGFAFGNLLVFGAMRKFGLFQIIPIARDWVLERIDDAVIIFDLNHRIVDLNPSALSLATHTNPIGQTLKQAFPDFHAFLENAEVENAVGEVTLNDVAGARHFEGKRQTLKDSQGKIRGKVALLREITLRKKLEADLAAYRSRLEDILSTRNAELADTFTDLRGKASAIDALEQNLMQAGKMEAVGLLAGGIAHDFNNLLAPILGFTELAVMEARKGRDVMKYLELITEVSEHAARLIRQILAFSRKNGKEVELFDLNEMVRENTTLIKRFLPENIQLEVTGTSIPRMLRGERTQFEQVLLNLCINARDAMPGGGRISIESDFVLALLKPQLESLQCATGRFILLKIKDTGIGMDAETKSHIFEPFYTTKMPGKGTGLGLETVNRIVAGHGGFLEIASQLGKGTEFLIYIPEARLDAGFKPEPLVKTIHPFTNAEGGNETILIVEDDITVRRLACEALRVFGYSTLEAENAEAALKVSESFERPIHLLLTDISLPGVNGRDLSASLRQARPEMQVLFMTGYSEGFPNGEEIMPGFIRKPFYITELLTGIRTVLISSPAIAAKT